MNLPPLNITSNSASRADSALDAAGSIFHASGNGDWNVSMGGTAPTLNISTATVSLLAAAVGVALWLFLKK